MLSSLVNELVLLVCYACNHVVSSTTTSVIVADDVITHAQQWMSGQHNVNPTDKPKRVIVLNWMQDLDTLLQHFSDFSPAGSEIVFVHQEKKQFIPGRIGSVRFRQVQCPKPPNCTTHSTAILGDNPDI